MLASIQKNIYIIISMNWYDLKIISNYDCVYQKFEFNFIFEISKILHFMLKNIFHIINNIYSCKGKALYWLNKDNKAIIWYYLKEI